MPLRTWFLVLHQKLDSLGKKHLPLSFVDMFFVLIPPSFLLLDSRQQMFQAMYRKEHLIFAMCLSYPKERFNPQGLPRVLPQLSPPCAIRTKPTSNQIKGTKLTLFLVQKVSAFFDIIVLSLPKVCLYNFSFQGLLLYQEDTKNHQKCLANHMMNWRLVNHMMKSRPSG